MHSRSTTIIGAGVAVALLGALMVFVYAHNLRGSAGAASGSSVGAYVVTAPITAGTTGSGLTGEIKATSVPTAARPADAVTSLTQLTGLVSLRRLEPGEVLTTSQFGTAGTPSTDTSGLVIPAGMNAVSVNVPNPQDVAGYVSPGDKVNIFMTSRDIAGIVPGAPAEQSARLLLSNVGVLSTVVANTPAAVAPVPATGPEVWTLALSPTDTEKLLVAVQYEQLWFSLVHPGDPPAVTTGQVATSITK
ncbi:MAG TPA: Flp pilus assembly protein CpaB [Actinomycetota bacterium]|nr:Flp pilus assembly protein CpaB [Actinomycetota bacterium]